MTYGSGDDTITADIPWRDQEPDATTCGNNAAAAGACGIVGSFEIDAHRAVAASICTGCVAENAAMVSSGLEHSSSGSIDFYTVKITFPECGIAGSLSELEVGGASENYAEANYFYAVDKTGEHFIGKYQQGTVSNTGTIKYASSNGGQTSSADAGLYSVTRANAFGGAGEPNYFYMLVYCFDNGANSDFSLVWSYAGGVGLIKIPFEYWNSDAAALSYSNSATNFRATSSTAGVVVYDNEGGISDQTTSTVVSAWLST